MTNGAHPSTRAFLEATRELTAALDTGDSTALLARIARQLECFEMLRAEVSRPGTIRSPGLAPTIAAAEAALSVARRQLLEVRGELTQLRHARASAAQLRTNQPNARFISRRV